VAERCSTRFGFDLDPSHVALTGWCDDCREE
jgi:hypothetical protein